MKRVLILTLLLAFAFNINASTIGDKADPVKTEKSVKAADLNMLSALLTPTKVVVKKAVRNVRECEEALPGGGFKVIHWSGSSFTWYTWGEPGGSSMKSHYYGSKLAGLVAFTDCEADGGVTRVDGEGGYD
ncbi:MAG: hypothetical protein KUG81_02430 [Gammaproteobacteria bacterium]|nr:hypothetical protein [Gammaproteobacteria bacterium]